MGVPNFYGWLCSRYPLIKAAYDEKILPIIDELYLDLNGIIYRCVNDDASVFKDMLRGKKFEEIWVNVFNYINEIIQHVKPGKLLFLGFDGVAPRAKMNQQRSRRFKAARKYDELDEALRKSGILEKEEHFKNNSISPGTEFMIELNEQIKFFIQRKMMEDSSWRKLKIIYSGVDNEGEGEHKIIEYIRRKCQEKDFDPNISICFYGPDADLIMLALSTHLPNVVILREELGFKGRISTATRRNVAKNKYDFVFIGVLREYIQYEYLSVKEKMGDRFDVERVIDDFIFLCFFIGNDFLPRVFCMDVKKGSFDKVIEIFKKNMIENGYIVEKGVLIWHRATSLFKAMAEFELESFHEKLHEQKAALRTGNNQARRWEDRQQGQENLDEVMKVKEAFLEYEGYEDEGEDEEEEEEEIDEELLEKKAGGKRKQFKQIKKKSAVQVYTAQQEESNGEVLVDSKSEVIKEEEKQAESSLPNEIAQGKGVLKHFLASMALERDIDFMTSLIKLYKDNRSDARNYYYQEKFGFDANTNRVDLLNLLTKYMEGMQFVLSYYYTNCPSWTWYFPYHYSPLVSDLANLLEYLQLPSTDNKKIQFDLSKPFDPFKQLMLILPTNSSHLLPAPLKSVISDTKNPLNPYYPKVFSVDPFGAAFESEYIALIPFVDEELLTQEYLKIEKSAYTKEEIFRNRHYPNILYEWDDNSQPIAVQSTLAYFDNFTAPIKSSLFELSEIPFSEERIYLGQRNNEVINLSFPSMELLANKSAQMTVFTKRRIPFKRCCFNLKNKYDPKAYKDLLGKSFYYGFPLMKECRLLAIVTPAMLISNYSAQELGYEYNRKQHTQFYTEILNDYGSFYYEDFGIYLDGPETDFAIIEYSYEFRKHFDGGVIPMMASFCVPMHFLIEKTFDVKFRKTISNSSVRIEQEFPKGNPVIINVGPSAGSTALVTRYSKSYTNQLDIEVKIYRYMREDIAKQIKQIAMSYESHYSYLRVRNVADTLGISVETVLAILGSVIIKSDQSINSKNIYAEKFDVGLNLIKSRFNMLVPELIIFDEKNKARGEVSTKHFFLSPEAKTLLEQYTKHCKPIISALETQLKNRNPDPLTAKGVFKGSTDPNLDLLKSYIWIMKAENANLIQANHSSKVLPREGIQLIEQYIKNTKQDRNKPPPKQHEYGTYNPNFLYPHYEDYWIPPTFAEQPQWHFIGDRVANLKCSGANHPPFGAQGTVVGILGNKYENNALEVKLELLFDEPFIGGTNLGGRCSWGHGAIVNFSEVFNIKWSKSVISRDKKSYNLDFWDGSFRRRYMPKFNDLSAHNSIHSVDESDASTTKKTEQKANAGYLSDNFAATKLNKHSSIASSGGEEITKSKSGSEVEYIEAPPNPSYQKSNQKQSHVVPKSSVVYNKKEQEQEEPRTQNSKGGQYYIKYEPKAEAKLPEKSTEKEYISKVAEHAETKSSKGAQYYIKYEPKAEESIPDKPTQKPTADQVSKTTENNAPQNRKKLNPQAKVVYVVKKEADDINS